MLRFFNNWNWGKGITVAIILLCCGILTIVYKATTYNYDMVLSNYYEEELNFNDNVAASRNARALSQPIRISQENGYIMVEFPGECAGKDLKGSLQLYRASDAARDITVPIHFVSGTVVTIPETAAVRGYYNVIARWTMDGKAYKATKDFQVF
ncbi:MAG: hypothetical protein BGO09_14370 [Bacteroidetes bacterium 47-18]|nr:MAG: hypothetical protein BGO09_14370 [Bacteroidetes bacterium 47-18]